MKSHKNNIPVNSGTALLWDSFFLKEAPVFSPTAEYFTGYKSDEINSFPGRGFNLLDFEEAERIKGIIARFVINNTQNELELVYGLKTKSGSKIWLKEFVLVKRNSGGNIISSECSVSDFTELLSERKALHAELVELQNLNKAKDKFISVLSHDLKSPYTSILGFSDILLNETSLSPEERLEYLQFINLSSHSQLKLIDNLLEWSRLVTGRKKIEKYKLNLKNLINSVISNNTRSIHLKNLDIKVNADSYTYVEADERLMDLVLNIFISNAVKYSLPEKTIEIYANRFKDNFIEVIVKDEGTGMNDNVRQRLMKIDSIVSIPGTKGERGTGISLLLANEIIKSHDGELWFYSEEGRGSEFHFTIPAASNIIFLIDNDETEKAKINNMLKAGFPQFRCVMETNFYSALDKIRNKMPAMIIMEHKLPLMNGLEFIKTMKSEEKYASVPLIIYTNDLTEKLRAEYLSSGMGDVLPGPVNLKDLKALVEKNLK